MILRLSLDLPDDVQFVPLARQVGRGLLEYLKVVPRDVGDVESIITELVANVVRHAKPSNNRFRAVLEFHADRVVITVIDEGRGFSFREIPAVGTTRPAVDGDERIGGFGLPLIEALSDKVIFHRTDPQGTTVHAEKVLHYLSQRDADEASAMNDGAATAAVSIGGAPLSQPA